MLKNNVILVVACVAFMYIQEISSQACSNGVPRRDCRQVNFCDTDECPAYPSASCRMDPCLGCRPIHSTKGSDLHPRDCVIATPDKRCSVPSSPTSCTGTERDECKGSENCPPGEMCCRRGCTHVCVSEVRVQNGVCPAQSSTVVCSVAPEDRRPSCELDSNCLDYQKCCSSQCGWKTCEDVLPKAVGNCPDGSTPFNCADPCTKRLCDAFPGAECKLNNCGSCYAEFFDKTGEKVDCTDFGPSCTTCHVNPCSYESCMAYPNAVCRPNWCPSCLAEFFVGGNKVDCSRTCKKCDHDPCSGKTCARVPTATCRSDRCDCTYDFVGDNGAVLDCTPLCKPCSGNPCNGKTCPGSPSATCTSNVCACTYRFEDVKGQAVDCTPKCVSCDRDDPCSGRMCAGDTSATCISDKCACTYAFLNSNGAVADCTPKCTKPDGTQGVPVNCVTNPCATAKCASRPEAQCEANYCGECSAIFKVNNRVVDCSICANGNRFRSCSSNVCSSASCSAITDAVCRTDSCDKCKADFYHPTSNKKYTLNECKVAQKPGNCPALGGTSCRKPCNRDSDCRSNYKCCSNGCGRFCRPPVLDSCPNGQMIRTCSAFLCWFDTCPAQPNAVCKSDPCDSCKVKFTLGDRVLQKSECEITTVGECPETDTFDPWNSFFNCVNYCNSDRDCTVAGQKCCSSSACFGSICKTPVQQTFNFDTFGGDSNACSCDDPCAGKYCTWLPWATCKRSQVNCCVAEWFDGSQPIKSSDCDGQSIFGDFVIPF